MFRIQQLLFALVLAHHICTDRKLTPVIHIRDGLTARAYTQELPPQHPMTGVIIRLNNQGMHVRSNEIFYSFLNADFLERGNRYSNIWRALNSMTSALPFHYECPYNQARYYVSNTALHPA